MNKNDVLLNSLISLQPDSQIAEESYGRREESETELLKLMIWRELSTSCRRSFPEFLGGQQLRGSGIGRHIGLFQINPDSGYPIHLFWPLIVSSGYRFMKFFVRLPMRPNPTFCDLFPKLAVTIFFRKA